MKLPVVAEARAAEEARIAAEARAAEAKKLPVLLPKPEPAEAARIAARRVPRKKLPPSPRCCEKLPKACIAAEARAAEEARVAAEAPKTPCRRGSYCRRSPAAEEARIAAEARAAEEARMAAEAQAAEEARVAKEAQRAEDPRLVAAMEAEAAAWRSATGRQGGRRHSGEAAAGGLLCPPQAQPGAYQENIGSGFFGLFVAERSMTSCSRSWRPSC